MKKVILMKEKIKTLFVRPSGELKQTLRENEIKTNKLMLILTAIITGVIIVYWALSHIIPKTLLNSSELLGLVIYYLISTGIVALICFVTKFKPRAIKYFLIIVFTDLIISCSTQVMQEDRLILVFPLIMCTRYYSMHFSLFSSLYLIFSSYWLPLIGSIVSSDDQSAIIIKMLTQYSTDIIIEMVPLYIFITLLCVVLAYNGRSTLQRQSEISQKMARTQADLDMAKSIQISQLPAEFPVRDEFEIHAEMHPAKEVGGDLYDCFMIDDDHMGIVIGDVSGKGVPASLFMMMTRKLLNHLGTSVPEPSEVIRQLNVQLEKGNEENMFVTVWYGVLTISTGEVKAVNAGHNFPVIKNPEGKFEKLKIKSGPFVGGLPKAKYRQYEFKLEKGSTMFIYTDGVEDACNIKDECFGSDRMIETLNANSECNPKELISAMMKALDDYSKGAEQFDDITMLALSYK